MVLATGVKTGLGWTVLIDGQARPRSLRDGKIINAELQGLIG